MKLGRRVAAILISLVGALVLLLYAAATLVVHRAFEETEATYARHDLARARVALNNVVDDIDRSVADWSHFDDAYAFARTRSDAFVKANLTPSVMNALDLDALVITDTAGRPVWSGEFGRAHIRIDPAPTALADLVRPGGPLHRSRAGDPAAKGVVMLRGGAMAVAARPLLTSAGTGPARGVLVMGRYLGPERVRRISDDLQVRVVLHELDAPSLAPEARRDLAALDEAARDDAPIYGRGAVSVCGRVRDVAGVPALLLQVTMPRDISRQGQRATALFGLLLVASCLAFAFSFAFVLRRHVISRLERLSDEVGRVDLKAETLPQVAAGGTDEISSLAACINVMLARVAESRGSAVESRRQYDALFGAMPAGCALHEMVYDDDGRAIDYRFLAANAAFETITTLKVADIIGRTATEVLPGLEPVWVAAYAEVVATGVPARFTDYSAGLGRHFDVVAFRADPGRFACVVTDVTDQKRADAEREALQAQLAQAQKMEAVGRLAGGVAHDFNNMLMAVLTNAELARDELPSGHAAVEHLDEIDGVARRSANLTRQLLAFARRQPSAPVVLDVNAEVGAMLKMLRRLIGEDIELVWKPGPGLWLVKVDPSQIDQLMVNAGVNARDAMLGPGTLTVETANVTLDGGDYVMLAVSDTGHGMDAETLQHVFEPFYTTKVVGEGTGLGLATVFGIMQQNSGFVRVESEPGRGATFRMYLPRSGEEAPADAAVAVSAPEAAPPRRGGETILLVEDERPIRISTQRLLERLGYRVMSAESPEEAVATAGAFEGEIDLLLTDVVMPHMSGVELAQALCAARPGLRCIYMSGYTANVIAEEGVLGDGVRFLAKPFARETLAAAIREALDQPR
ncbi:MAG: response regulator [Armatimonadetes bacterium]|nr:response regulator [Armatimonadota bacterium]